MIEIKCAANDTAIRLCQSVGIHTATVLEMIERDQRLGFVCMMYSGEEVALLHLEAPDVPLTDALMRAALNSARSSGAKTARIQDETLFRFAVKKGYLENFTDPQIEIANFFAKSACKA